MKGEERDERRIKMFSLHVPILQHECHRCVLETNTNKKSKIKKIAYV